MTKKARIRHYKEEFLKYGFANSNSNGQDRPQCVFCNTILCNESLKKSKLENHLINKHPSHKDKELSHYKRNAETFQTQLKKMTPIIKTSPTVNYRKLSYELSLLIAKTKNAYTLGESVIKPSIQLYSNHFPNSKCKYDHNKLGLSPNTVKSRIQTMSKDIISQVITRILSCSLGGFYSLQLDESTDVENTSRLSIFIRWAETSNIYEHIFAIIKIDTSTKGVDIFNILKDRLKLHNLKWENFIGLCTDGAPSMQGSKSGLKRFVLDKSPNCVFNHCIIHRVALASKVLPLKFTNDLQFIVEIVNLIKKSPKNSRILEEICKDLDVIHTTLIYYSHIRWLSRGNMLKRFYELLPSIIIYFENKYNEDNCTTSLSTITKLKSVSFTQNLSYLTDIFEHLNKVNISLQGKNSDMITLFDRVKALQSKVNRMKSEVNRNMFVSFPTLSYSESTVVNKTLILNHLSLLSTSLKNYFPSTLDNITELILNPYSYDIERLATHELKDQFTDLVNDSSLKITYKSKGYVKFWCQSFYCYKSVSEFVLRFIIPFASTYLCECSFSSLLKIKSKERNKLEPEAQLIVALSDLKPDIEKISRLNK